MARKRFVSPDFFTHPGLHDHDTFGGLLRIVFIGLWCQCDRRGIFSWRPRVLKLAILPYDDVDFSAILETLWTAGFVERYVVDGEEYGLIRSFPQHQHFHPSERPSRAPNPDVTTLRPRADPVTDTVWNGVSKPASTTAYIHTSDPLRNGVVHGKRAKSGSATRGEPAGFAACWAAYPTRPNNSRAAALKAYRARLAEPHPPTEEALLAGTRAYAAYARTLDPRYIKLAATFYGPDRHWESAYTSPEELLPPQFIPDPQNPALQVENPEFARTLTRWASR